MKEEAAVCLSLAIISLVCALVFVIFAISTGCNRCVDSRQPGNERVVTVWWFTAKWCPPCRQQVLEVEKILEDVWYSRHDIHECQSLVKRHNVSVVPTYIVTIDSKEIGRAHNPNDLKKLLRK